ncbi:hypothetical protein F751_1371 [Auxenochlorella protothecoides]|uniref:Secreted protein n=1 Tax=Auxenochlorella protothecoides TaxID=3075 RepID=A0A087SEF2_AUXPR|nr:hypothetical protein F751_1371 [Auxenochlorella protothecoides]KFM24106.1 hypothetical protein F751_1371 [Auxenochlorella protothecoides]
MRTAPFLLDLCMLGQCHWAGAPQAPARNPVETILGPSHLQCWAQSKGWIGTRPRQRTLPTRKTRRRQQILPSRECSSASTAPLPPLLVAVCVSEQVCRGRLSYYIHVHVQ